jgi:hypothetical protein
VKYFYDTEFHEDGKTIDFISIGIVAEDGREFYAVSSDFDTRRVARNDWLMNNVMSTIDHDQFITYDYLGLPAVRDLYVTDKAVLPKERIAKEIMYFIGGDRSPQFWAWYSAYDHVCLAQLFGTMHDLPGLMPMYTNDLRTLVDLARLKPSNLPKQAEGLHNALADARQNRVRYDFLMEILENARPALPF